MCKKSKAQISTEFIIILAAILSVFLIIFGIANARIDEFHSTHRLVAAKGIADKLALAVNQVYISGLGSNSSMYLPEKMIDVIDYNLTVFPDSRLVQVEWGERAYGSGLMVSVNGGNDAALSPGLVEIKYNESGVFLVQ